MPEKKSINVKLEVGALAPQMTSEAEDLVCHL